tara:strand:- start:3866 stop:4843 length:978 start_codon:yes stop_codon:yes gene_type:complete
MKIFVIGLNSFIGSSYIKYILQNKYINKIYGCSRSKMNLDILKDYNKKIVFYKIDLNKDINKLIKILKIIKPNIIFNFAAQSIVEASWRMPLDWFNTNLISNIKLIEYLKNVNYLKKYIYSSTPEVYGSTKNKIKENFSYFPNTPYATSKASLDMLLKNYYDQYKFPVILTRIANIYGPGQQVFKIIPKSIISIKKNIKIPLHGGGKSKRSFIYSDDVSEALYLISKKAKPGNIYHISNEKKISIKDLIKTICDVMGKDFNLIVRQEKDRLGKDLIYDMSSNKIENELKWRSKVSLLKGIIKTKSWIDKNFYKIKKYKLAYVHKK